MLAAQTGPLGLLGQDCVRLCTEGGVLGIGGHGGQSATVLQAGGD